jgi:uncharacterized protein (DUF433 family)
MMGKPIIEGTRIAVELILEKLGTGESVDQILSAHPRLTAEGIHAVLAFATLPQKTRALACLETSAHIN